MNFAWVYGKGWIKSTQTQKGNVMSDTKWTPVDGYEIKEDGRIISHKTNWRGYGSREIKWADDRSGYPVVRMTDANGKRLKFKVHQLVCRAYHGEKPTALHEVRHLDGDPMNNNASNLAWGTRSENAIDRVKHGNQYMPPWHDGEFKKKMSIAMTGVKKKRSSQALAKARGEM